MRKGLFTNPTGPHLSESIFRTYEPFFERLLACHPEPLSITPSGIVPRTFCARMRDAANAFILYRYASSLDYDTFVAVWKSVVCRPTFDKVIIGPRAGVAAVSEDIGRETTVASTLDRTVDSPTTDQLLALANLYVTGLATNPTRITGKLPIGNLPPGVILSLQPDGSYLLL